MEEPRAVLRPSAAMATVAQEANLMITKCRRTNVLVVAVVGAALYVVPAPASAEGFHRGRTGTVNAQGGVTTGSFQGVRGASGGAVRASGATTDGAGNAAGGRAAAFKGPGGATGLRGGKWTRSADGSVTHDGGAALSGSAGTVKSQGSTSKNADGTYAAQRDTTATSASGYTYDGSTTASDGQVAHTGTCTDPSGNTVSCSK